MASRTAARLAHAFLAYLALVAILVTLVPFDFTVPDRIAIYWSGSVPDFIANVMMFVPLGFLFRLTRHGAHERWAVGVLVAGGLFSFGIEAAQLFLPSRMSAPLDLVANGLGAWIGALAHDQAVRRLRVTPALIGALALELPLMGLIYLLVPLLWLSGLAASDDRGRLVLSLLLGLSGALVLGAVFRYRLGPGGAVSRGRYGLIAFGWFLAGALPGLMTQPFLVLAAAAAVGITTVLWTLEPLPGGGPDRRFEAQTLTRLAPLFVLYLLFLAGWPPWSEWVPFHGSLGAAQLWGAANTLAIIRALEQLASFTLLGYLVAEGRGRLERSYRDTAGALILVGLVTAILVEGVAALHPGGGASVVRAVLAVAAACYGGSIYHLQRSHIRWLLQSGLRSIVPVSGGDPAGMQPPPHNLARSAMAGSGA